MILRIIRRGTMEYSRALSFQQQLMTERQKGMIDDTLILLEHFPVITVGKGRDESNILVERTVLEARGVAVHKAGRGGDVTFHGPGQIVGYVIMDLAFLSGDIRLFVKKIENAFVGLLKDEYRIDARNGERTYTGVWVNDDKILAIGLSVHHGVTMHGFAFNVNTDLTAYGWINPCGFTDRGVTSLRKITGTEQDMNAVGELVVQYFCREFSRRPVIV